MNIEEEEEQQPHPTDLIDFSRSTRKLPVLFFSTLLLLTVILAGLLAHDWSTWNGFWNTEAVLRRDQLPILKNNSFVRAVDLLTSWINELVVKAGWALAVVSLAAIQAFYIWLLRMPRVAGFLKETRIKTVIIIELVVLITASLYWFLSTFTFSFLADHFGSCTRKQPGQQQAEQLLLVEFPVSGTDCIDGEFRGFDISGHCFIIVLSALLLLEYLSKAAFLWRQVKATRQFDSELKDQSTCSHSHLNLLFLFLCSWTVVFLVSEFLVYLQTVLFYHTVTEKLLGTILGAAFWIVLYFLSFKYPHLF